MFESKIAIAAIISTGSIMNELYLMLAFARHSSTRAVILAALELLFLIGWSPIACIVYQF
jgi:hypothetical protein